MVFNVEAGREALPAVTVRIRHRIFLRSKRSITSRSKVRLNMTNEKAQKRARAEAWVNGHTATAVGTVCATAIIPFAATGILCTLEGTMCYQIGKIYRQNWTVSESATVAGVIGLAAVAGQIAALEAAILTGPFAFAIKPAIAGGIVKTMGQLVIKHFEDCS
jgi:uncharacterized protein (DUF697 family)